MEERRQVEVRAPPGPSPRPVARLVNKRLPPPPQEDVAQLQRRLAALTERHRRLQLLIQQEQLQDEAAQLQRCLLLSCSTTQLQHLHQTLQDRDGWGGQISGPPPLAMLRSAHPPLHRFGLEG